MTIRLKYCASIFRNSPRRTNFALMLLCALTIVALPTAQAQTFNVIHNFTGGADGASPSAGLTMDNGGNLYGTTTYMSVFKMRNTGSGWVLNPLYDFSGDNDGELAYSAVTIGPDGSLYGTTLLGGSRKVGNGGGGTVYNLRPSPQAPTIVFARWKETLPYQFAGPGDGGRPISGVIFDQAGNLYGTTDSGGEPGCARDYGCGVVYKLTPSGGGWTQSVIYSFTGGNDGANPDSDLIFDQAGNLYGATAAGGNDHCDSPIGCGTVFQLTPSGGGWTEHVLYTFQNGSDGAMPQGGLVRDQNGNLYGTTPSGGAGGGGTVFELTPSGGGWTFSLLYSFTGKFGSMASLVMDAVGSLCGTTQGDGKYGFGNVFKLSLSNGGWAYASLYDFTGGADGANPSGSVIFDAGGNLYGTTFYGGTGSGGICDSTGCGVVWEITP